MDELTRRLEPYLADAALLRRALTHRSFCAESGTQESNERLEHLGDAVLGLVVSEQLFHDQPDVPEGDLARMRAAVVSTAALAPIAERAGVGRALLLGRGEDASGGRSKPSLLADALEAVIGATYLASGLDGARGLVLELLGEKIAEVSSGIELGDAKNRLQELASRRGEDLPRYEVRESGPDHAKRFAAAVTVGREVVGRGAGSSKKQAERAAALDALETLRALSDGAGGLAGAARAGTTGGDEGAHRGA